MNRFMWMVFLKQRKSLQKTRARENKWKCIKLNHVHRISYSIALNGGRAESSQIKKCRHVVLIHCFATASSSFGSVAATFIDCDLLETDKDQHRHHQRDETQQVPEAVDVRGQLDCHIEISGARGLCDVMAIVIVGVVIPQPVQVTVPRGIFWKLKQDAQWLSGVMSLKWLRLLTHLNYHKLNRETGLGREVLPKWQLQSWANITHYRSKRDIPRPRHPLSLRCLLSFYIPAQQCC